MLKRILGYVLKVFAFVLGLAVLSQIVELFASIITIFKTILGLSDSYELGFAIGQLIANGLFVLIIYYSWKFGSELIRRSKS